MSSSTSIVYGRGFETSDISLKTILKFVQNHKETVMTYINTGERIFDHLSRVNLDELPDTVSGMDTLPEELEAALSAIQEFDDRCEPHNNYACIIEIIINKENPYVDIAFTPGQADCEGDASILLRESMPWQLTEKEKSFETVDAFDEFLKPYVEELGLTTDAIDYLKVEYYG